MTCIWGMTWKMRLVELRNMLGHLTSIKGKSLMVPAPCQKSNHWQIMLKTISVTKYIFVLIIPVINNKLAPMINGIKLPYTAVNSILMFACFVRSNKMHLGSLWGNCVVLDLNEINNIESRVKHIDAILAKI